MKMKPNKKNWISSDSCIKQRNKNKPSEQEEKKRNKIADADCGDRDETINQMIKNAVN